MAHTGSDVGYHSDWGEEWGFRWHEAVPGRNALLVTDGVGVHHMCSRDLCKRGRKLSGGCNGSDCAASQLPVVLMLGVQCTPCQNGTIAESSRAAQCLPCGPGTRSTADGTSCTVNCTPTIEGREYDLTLLSYAASQPTLTHCQAMNASRSSAPRGHAKGSQAHDESEWDLVRVI